MTRPTTVRIPKEILREVDERCGKTGCTRNDFIKNAIEFTLTGHSEFDFGDEDEEPEETPVEEVKEVRSDEEKHEPHYDKHGNYWTYDKNRKIWCCRLNPENVKIKP